MRDSRQPIRFLKRLGCLVLGFRTLVGRVRAASSFSKRPLELILSTYVWRSTMLKYRNRQDSREDIYESYSYSQARRGVGVLDHKFESTRPS